MRKTIGIGSFGVLAVVALFLLSAMPMAGASDYAYSTTQKLYAGKNDIGATVKVTHDTAYFYVTYSTIGGWKISETHLAFSVGETCNIDGIPQTKKGNPIPGQFPYSNTHDPMVTTLEYKVAFSELEFAWGDYVCIAAHAVVKKVEDGVVTQEQTGWAGESNFPGKNWALYFCYHPAKVLRLPKTVTATIDNPGTNSYWDVDVTGGGSGDLPDQNNWLGWCVDKTVTIGEGSHSFTVVPYYDTANVPSDEQSNNWFKINYVLNNKGKLDANQIQNVLWAITGDVASTSLSTTELALYNDANTNGGNFYPEAGEYMAVILQKTGSYQTIIIEVDP